MSNKTVGAFIIGGAIWVIGALAIILFGQSPLFPPAAVPAAFLLMPAMYWITRFHLRDIPKTGQAGAAIRLGVIATAIQFPLDALGWAAIFYLHFPPLSQSAQSATVLALAIGYFCLLVTPWWISKRLA